MNRIEKDILNDILYCYVQLSPENIWMDGEATQKEADIATKKYTDRLKKLFIELGREVSEEEAYSNTY